MKVENENLDETLVTGTLDDSVTDVNDGSASESEDETLLGGTSADEEEESSSEEEESSNEEDESSEEDDVKSEKKTGEIKDGKYIVDDYEIVVPEGQEFNSELLDSIVPVFQDLDLENEAVQKIVDGYANAVKVQVDSQIKKSMDYYKTITDGWKKEALKELGANSKKKLADAAIARDKLGDKDFVKMLQETGVGNHPAMIRMLIKAGKLVREDSFPDPNQPNNNEKEAPEKVLYPSMNK